MKATTLSTCSNSICRWASRAGALLALLAALALAGPGCSRYPEMAASGPEKAPAPAAAPAKDKAKDTANDKANDASPPLPAAAPQPSPYYRIGPEDVLSVRVWDHDDLSREVTVSQAGVFSFPLIGQVRAGGRTAAEVEEVITKRLADGYLKNPQVSVTVKAYRSQKVYVVGEVKSPGTFPLMGPTRVVEILSLASGVTENAGSRLLVVRPRGEGRRNTPTPLDEAQAGEVIELDLNAISRGNISQDILLHHGDTIIVPEAEYYYVRGEVKKPGRFKYSEGLTVIEAITVAGGATELAALSRTRLMREKDGKRRESKVSLTEPVRPGDVITVPESFF